MGGAGKNFCALVNQGCKAPAGIGIGGGGGYYDSAWDDPPTYAKATCYACGNPICSNDACSKRVTYDKARRRLCVNCIEERLSTKATNQEPERL